MPGGTSAASRPARAASATDGPGRQESKKLSRNGALAYATESMRLTTRLMQLASWLLLHRAVKEGEETRPEYRMPGAPVTNYVSLAFLLIVVLSNLTSKSGRWTLALFAIVAIAMVAGWYAVRDKIKPDLLDNVVPSDEGM